VQLARRHRRTDGHYTLHIAIDTKHLVDQDNVLPDTASIEIELAGNTVTSIASRYRQRRQWAACAVRQSRTFVST